jgi:antitoxin CptB
MLKKLIYKSHYRGTKEGDFILSSFAKHALKNYSIEEIKAYEELLEYSDGEIQAWLLSAQNIPVHLKKIVIAIRKFHKLSGVKKT